MQIDWIVRLADWVFNRAHRYSNDWTRSGHIMSEKRSASEWSEFVSGCVDFRPAEGVYRIAREMFTEPELFSLEMEHIFEKAWIYACHESEIANNNDFVTMRAGRQPLIITRDGSGNLNAMINACQHRGATL